LNFGFLILVTLCISALVRVLSVVPLAALEILTVPLEPFAGFVKNEKKNV
jgi:hypothetical protein